MRRGRMGTATRWIVAALALLVASAVVSLRHPQPQQPGITVTALDLLPAIFTTSKAIGPPVTTGCKGTPVPPADKLQITLKALAFKGKDVNNVDVTTSVLPAAVTLDFAQNAGTTVGNFVSNATLDPGVTYTKLSLTVGSVLSISCTVTCDPMDPAHPGIQNWVTKGGSALTSPDLPGGAAITSSITINNGVETSQDLTLPTPIVNGNNTVPIKFSNNAACELWDISNLTGNPAKTDFKIIPGAPSPKP